jgi:hypothetical protein
VQGAKGKENQEQGKSAMALPFALTPLLLALSP